MRMLDPFSRNFSGQSCSRAESALQQFVYTRSEKYEKGNLENRVL